MMLSVVVMMSAMYSLPWRTTVIGGAPVVGNRRTVLNQTVFEFLGIRYATADRFEEPKLFKPHKLTSLYSRLRGQSDDDDDDDDEERLKPWFNAKTLGDVCPGSSLLFVNRSVGTSEDCLFLNVWVPKTRLFFFHSKLPVIVYIHGGTYNDGAGHNTDGAVMVASAEEPVIVVTLNYRQNIFGFLGSDNLRSGNAAGGTTGNWGLMDQRMALNWVQKYIKFFGGDEDRVTIWGNSAGAGSVANQMIMQNSRGLFNKAILESTYFASKTLAEAETQFQQVLNYTFCNQTTYSTPKECLQRLPMGNLTTVAFILTGLSFVAWEPTLDGVELNKLQWQAFRDGDFDHSVQVMIGTTSEENAAFLPFEVLLTQDPAVFQFLVTPTLVDPSDFAEVDNLYTNVRQYPTDRGIFSDTAWKIVAAGSDNVFFCTSRRALLDIAKYSDHPPYYFMTAYPIKSTTLFQVGNPNQVFNVHTSTIPLFWNCPRIPDLWDCQWELESDARLALEMSRLYSRFASNGNPGGEWTAPYSNTTDEIFVMGTPTEVGGPGFHYQTSLNKQMCEFWDRQISLID